MLNSHGFQASSAETAADAVALARKTDFDVYLLDVRLPDRDGLSLCKELKQLHPNTPIIFCSAQALPNEIEKTLIQCGDDYFTKPLNWSSLIASIRRLIDEG
jgi:DNA-binding response OmpR family regulator